MTRRPPPHMSLHVELMDWVGPISVNWPDWRRLRGGGLRSWLRWVFTGGHVTRADKRELLAMQCVEQRECHRYQGIEHCYCHETFGSREWERHYREALESLS